MQPEGTSGAVSPKPVSRQDPARRRSRRRRPRWPPPRPSRADIGRSRSGARARRRAGPRCRYRARSRDAGARQRSPRRGPLPVGRAPRRRAGHAGRCASAAAEWEGAVPRRGVQRGCRWCSRPTAFADSLHRNHHFRAAESHGYAALAIRQRREHSRCRPRGHVDAITGLRTLPIEWVDGWRRLDATSGFSRASWLARAPAAPLSRAPGVAGRWHRSGDRVRRRQYVSWASRNARSRSSRSSLVELLAPSRAASPASTAYSWRTALGFRAQAPGLGLFALETRPAGRQL